MPARRARPKTLAPVRANVGVERAYQKRLDALIDEMHRSILYWVKAAYRRKAPELHRVMAMAADDSPAMSLSDAVRRLRRRWTRKFDEAAARLADYFAEQMSRRSDEALRSILDKGGFSVKFQRTRAVNDVLQATVQENVALIKSIAQNHLSQVEGMVMRSVQTGRDLHQLTEDLERQFGVTRRRAALIAKDQNNKATGTIQRVRQMELGVKEAIWVHSGGGREPRRTHLQAGRDRVRYDIAQGWYDTDEKRYIIPGELINCRCVARPVVPGFS